MRPFSSFKLQTGTALHNTNESFQFGIAVGDDIFGIKKWGTGSHSTEVHVLSAASGYRSFSLQTGSGLHETNPNWAFLVAPNRDLFCIAMNNTGSHTTEVHVLAADSNYSRFNLQTRTALHETSPATFSFALAPNRDVFAIKRVGTGAHATEVHVLSAASNYQSFVLQTGTALHETPADFAFCVSANRDVYAIKKRNTGSHSTEVHVLSAASGYHSFSLQTGTGLHETDDSFEFLLSSSGHLFAIKKANTGSNSTEVHVLHP